MAKDIILDGDGDLLFTADDIVMGDGDKQNLETLLLSSTGSIKHTPLMGCDLYRLANARINTQDVVRGIRIQLKADSWFNEQIIFEGEELKVDAIRQ